jgi:hypothetical protein
MSLFSPLYIPKDSTLGLFLNPQRPQSNLFSSRADLILRHISYPKPSQSTTQFHHKLKDLFLQQYQQPHHTSLIYSQLIDVYKSNDVDHKLHFDIFIKDFVYKLFTTQTQSTTPSTNNWSLEFSTSSPSNSNSNSQITPSSSSQQQLQPRPGVGPGQLIKQQQQQQQHKHETLIITPLVPNSLISNAEDFQNRLLLTTNVLPTNTVGLKRPGSSSSSSSNNSNNANQQFIPPTPLVPLQQQQQQQLPISSDQTIPTTPPQENRTLDNGISQLLSPSHALNTTASLSNFLDTTTVDTLNSNLNTNNNKNDKSTLPNIIETPVKQVQHNQSVNNNNDSIDDAFNMTFHGLHDDINNTTPTNSSLQSSSSAQSISNLASSTTPSSSEIVTPTISAPAPRTIQIGTSPAPKPKEHKPIVIGADDLLILTVIVILRSSDLNFVTRLIEMMECIKTVITNIEREETMMIKQLSDLYQQYKYNNNNNHNTNNGSASKFSTTFDDLSPLSTPTNNSSPNNNGTDNVTDSWSQLQTKLTNFTTQLESNSESLNTRLTSLTSLLTSVPTSNNIGQCGFSTNQNNTDNDPTLFEQADPTTFLSSLMLTQDYYPGCSTLATQLQIIDDFIPEQERFMMTGYYLATTQAAVELLLTHEPNQVHVDEEF